MVYVAGAVVVVAVAGTVAVLVIPDRSQSPTEAVRPAEGNFTATSPWRLVIRNDLETGEGCNVTLTHTDSKGKKSMTGVYGTKSYQIPDAGNFEWEANDILCRVIQRSGPGSAVLPFVHQAGTGHSDAFTPPKTTGKIAVAVLDFRGGTECDFQLKDVADGRTVDQGTLNQRKGPLPLDASGRSQVYLADVACDARVSAR